MTTRSPFGTEFSTFVGGVPDLDPTFTERDDEVLVVERVARRWLTPRNSLPDLAGKGRDVRAYVQMRMLATQRARARAELRAEALDEEGVLDCDVTVEPAGDALRVVGVVRVRSGRRYRLTIQATTLRATLPEILPLET